MKNFSHFANSVTASLRRSPSCPSHTQSMPKQYHAFATIQLCYPSEFYGNSLQALGLPQNTNPKHHNSASSPTPHPSTTVLEETRKGNAATPMPAAPADAMAAKKMIGLSYPTIPIREISILGTKAEEEADANGKPVGGESRRVNSHSKSPRRRRRGPCVKVTARAPLLQPLPSAARGQPCSVVCGEGVDSRRGPGKVSYPKKHFRRQRNSSKVGCLTDAADGNGYWDIMGRKAGGHDPHDGDVRAGVEQSESAVASVVLLRWAMECFVGNEGEGDGVSSGGQRFGTLTSIGQAGDDDSAGGTSTFQGKASNAAVSGPVHLIRAERKPRDSNSFLFSDPLESGGKRSADASNSPRKVTSTSFAATSPLPLAFSRSQYSERPKEVGQALPRQLRVSEGSGRERRSPSEDDHQDRFASDVSVTNSPRPEETRPAASDEEGPGGRNTASRGALTEDARKSKR